MHTTVKSQQRYYCDVAGCQFGPVCKVKAVKMHKMMCHRVPETSKSAMLSLEAAESSAGSPFTTCVVEDRPSIVMSHRKQAYYCDVENCSYGPVWKSKALSMHKLRCHSSSEKSSHLVSDDKDISATSRRE